MTARQRQKRTVKSKKTIEYDFTYNRSKSPLDNIIEQLEEAGLTVNKIDSEDPIYIAEGNDLYIVILDNDIPQICADRKDLFNKKGSCPIREHIPSGKRAIKELARNLTWLSTKEGYKASKEYDMDQWRTKL